MSNSRKKSKSSRSAKKATTSNKTPREANAGPGGGGAQGFRPDQVKIHYTTFCRTVEPWAAKLSLFENQCRMGPLQEMPDIELWALEEFLWHGIPGDASHPLDDFLDRLERKKLDSDVASMRISKQEMERLQRWKEAEAGVYEIGSIRSGTIELRKWDPQTKRHAAESFFSISLSPDGIKGLRRRRGGLLFTYVAPWEPEKNMICAMGYATIYWKANLGMSEVLLNIRYPEIVAEPLPWKTSDANASAFMNAWSGRDWQDWLRQRLEFPFRVFSELPEKEGLHPIIIKEMAQMPKNLVEQAGIYFKADMPGKPYEVFFVGVSNVIPDDVRSPNWRPIQEYQEYRERVGPPPLAQNGTSFYRL